MEIKDYTEPEALITENLTCPITGIIYRVEEFPTSISIQQCWNCQSSDIRPKLVGPKPNALSLGRAIIIKDAQIKRKQLIKFVANVAIQVAQPQVCYANPNHDAIDKKSSLCCRLSEAAKNHLGVDITGISLFDAIGQSICALASKPRPLLPKVKPHSNSHHPPKSPNHPPYLNFSAPPPSSTNKVVPKQPKPFK